MESVKQWFKNNEITAMNLISYLVVGSVLLMFGFQMYKWGDLVTKKIITPEIYERDVTNVIEKLFQFGLAIITFFFGKDLGKKEGQKNTQNNIDVNKPIQETATKTGL